MDGIKKISGEEIESIFFGGLPEEHTDTLFVDEHSIFGSGIAIKLKRKLV